MIWRITRITGGAEAPANTWLYGCDTEADVTADIPEEAVMLVVAVPGDGKSPARIRNSNGEWKEVG